MISFMKTKKNKIPIKILIKNLVGWNKLELAMTLRSYVGLPLKAGKGRRRENKRISNGKYKFENNKSIWNFIFKF